MYLSVTINKSNFGYVCSIFAVRRRNVTLGKNQCAKLFCTNISIFAAIIEGEKNPIFINQPHSIYHISLFFVLLNIANTFQGKYSCQLFYLFIYLCILMT